MKKNEQQPRNFEPVRQSVFAVAVEALPAAILSFLHGTRNTIHPHNRSRAPKKQPRATEARAGLRLHPPHPPSPAGKKNKPNRTKQRTRNNQTEQSNEPATTNPHQPPTTHP